MASKIAFLNRFRKILATHELFGLRWLLDGFNHYDDDRVREVGPDRAAAEWVVRCEGKVRFDVWDEFIENYNDLLRRTSCLDPKLPQHQVHIISISAIHSSISGRGCVHLYGLKKIKEICFIHCKAFDDTGVEKVSRLTCGTLEKLRIESCPKVTEYGLRFLGNCSNLQFLLLRDLPRVYKKTEVLQYLKSSLPKCDICYPDSNIE
ncbi:unnamed protein product [Dracunculus medinensis]|uniref:ATP synthase subunit s, mitochondrial n=1 Tax=Dracunculus medinensis TaxID=318479 RepID=A0A0N4U4I9_DRAME|nr:unnamed protein product [Dracunculus medinensis]